MRMLFQYDMELLRNTSDSATQQHMGVSNQLYSCRVVNGTVSKYPRTPGPQERYGGKTKDRENDTTRITRTPSNTDPLSGIPPAAPTILSPKTQEIKHTELMNGTISQTR